MASSSPGSQSMIIRFTMARRYPATSRAGTHLVSAARRGPCAYAPSASSRRHRQSRMANHASQRARARWHHFLRPRTRPTPGTGIICQVACEIHVYFISFFDIIDVSWRWRGSLNRFCAAGWRAAAANRSCFAGRGRWGRPPWSDSSPPAPAWTCAR